MMALQSEMRALWQQDFEEAMRPGSKPQGQAQGAGAGTAGAAGAESKTAVSVGRKGADCGGSKGERAQD